MGAYVVNSYNLFLDSERNLSKDSTGDDVALPLGQSPIVAGTNQFIRLTLTEFSMSKSFHDVNALNNTFSIRDAGGVEQVVLLPSDYSSDFKMFSDPINFQKPILDALNTLVGGGLTTTFTLNNPTGASNDSNILSFTITYSAAHGYATNADVPKIQCYVSQGRAYTLLGGKRIVDDTDTTSASLTGVRGDSAGANLTTTLTYTAFYNASYFTSSHMYVRINEQNSNLGTSSLNSITEDTQRTQMSSTKVIGIIPIDTGYARYVASSENVFFTDISSKQVAQMRITITDALGNKFPLIAPDQDRLGNRHFTAVIRIDIYEYPSGGQHSTNNFNLESTTQARFSTQPATKVGWVQSNGLNGAQSGFYGNGFHNFQGKQIS